MRPAKYSATDLTAKGQRTHVNGHVLGLGGQTPLAVEDGGGEVAARVEDLK
jgi:hypothetical protein